MQERFDARTCYSKHLFNARWNSGKWLGSMRFSFEPWLWKSGNSICVLYISLGNMQYELACMRKSSQLWLKTFVTGDCDARDSRSFSARFYPSSRPRLEEQICPFRFRKKANTAWKSKLLLFSISSFRLFLPISWLKKNKFAHANGGVKTCTD